MRHYSVESSPCTLLTPFNISCRVIVERVFAPGLWLKRFSLVPLESTLFQHILYSNSIKSIASHFIASVVTTGANGGNALFLISLNNIQMSSKNT